MIRVFWRENKHLAGGVGLFGQVGLFRFFGLVGLFRLLLSHTLKENRDPHLWTVILYIPFYIILIPSFQWP